MKFSALALASAIFGSASAQVPTSLTFLHINDHHSSMEDKTFDLSGDFIPDLGFPAETIRLYYGAFDRNVALFSKLDADATAQGREVVKVHAGDAITGTFFYTAFGNAMDAAGLNNIGFDAFVLGNHEFDQGDANAADLIQRLNFPTLSANLNPREGSAIRALPEDKQVRPYIIKTLSNGEKLGICGITVKKVTEESSFPDEGTTVADEKASAESCVADLKSQSVNKIVLLTHIGLSNDVSKLSTIDGVDLIIGGHSHALMNSVGFQELGFSTRQDNYAEVVNGVCIVTAWANMRIIGNLQVDFDENGVVTACNGEPKIALNPDRYTLRSPRPRFDLNETSADVMTDALLAIPNNPFVVVEPDAATTAALEPFFTQSESQRNEVIGSASENICHTYTAPDDLCPDDELGNCLSGGICNLVSIGFLDNVKTADVAIQNRGGCRTDLVSGDVTIGNAFEILPFSNTLVTFEMTGDEIKAVLEDALAFYLDDGGGAGSYPFAAGLRYQIDETQPKGSRISVLEVNPQLSGEFEAIGAETTYTVVTNSFIAGGRDGYVTFTNDNIAATFVDAGFEYGQSFVNYIERLAAQGTSLSTPSFDLFSTQRIVTAAGQTCERIPDIVSTASASTDFTTLVSAIKEAGLVTALSTPNGPYTVFAPNEDAWEKLGDDAVECLLKNETVLGDILKYHVTEGATNSSMLEDGMEIATLLEGQSLTVSIDGETVKVDESEVATADIETENGYIHAIASVLVPESIDMDAFLANCDDETSSALTSKMSFVAVALVAVAAAFM